MCSGADTTESVPEDGQSAAAFDDDGRSTASYNEDRVSSAAILDALKESHPTFSGDWSHLERLVDAMNGPVSVRTWNEWKASEYPLTIVHLEGVNLGDWELEGIDFRAAHLEGAFGLMANLRKARLDYARLREAKLHHAQLEHASLNGADLRDADLGGAGLIGASLSNTRLQGADLRGTRLNDANLFAARMEGADCWQARMAGANLRMARLERVRLREVDFDRADVRKASGLRFDENKVHLIRIASDASDAWSVLRRKYTGPWFFLHLLLLLLFFSPYAARAVYLSTISDIHAFLEQQAAVMEERVDTSDRATRFMQTQKGRLEQSHKKRRAIWVLTGVATGLWPFTMVAVVVAYNVVRALLTLRVSEIRDAEERSRITPALREYWWLFRAHQVARVLMWAAITFAFWNAGSWVWSTWVWVPL